jgi:hypothetical protein
MPIHTVYMSITLLHHDVTVIHKNVGITSATASEHGLLSTPICSIQPVSLIKLHFLFKYTSIK